MKPRYPDIYVELIGRDLSGVSILARVLNALRKAGVPVEILQQFVDETRSVDYDRLLQVCQEWVDVG